MTLTRLYEELPLRTVKIFYKLKDLLYKKEKSIK